MSLDIEVRSGGPGPRALLAEEVDADPWSPGYRMGCLSEEMGERWTRLEVNHRGHMKWLSDGVAIVIRKTEGRT